MFSKLFQRHKWVYSHVYDPAYPNMKQDIMNFRVCSECKKEQGLDVDGWCNFIKINDLELTE